ncbi:MAG: alpha/beta fold hydrolase [Deltaproteobacteria bacterium]|nr:alpha/beta fold hydrolase [Deltaproteobacteria bacterium]
MDEALLFVHGWATDNRVWESIAGALAKERTVYNIDLPGHGGKKIWAGPSLDPAITEVSRYIAALPGKAVVGIGWSLGAQVLIASALREEKKFKALVLAGATPSFVEQKDFPWGQPKALVKRMIMDMKKDPAGTVERFYKLNFTDDEIGLPQVRDFIGRYKYPGPVSCETDEPGCFPVFKYNEITNALEALYNTDLRQSLGGLDIPILLVHGERDAICPVGAAHYLNKNIKSSRLVVFENAGHAPFLTEAERFKDVLKGFLAEI